MRMAILGAVIGATLMGTLPVSAQVVIHDSDSDRDRDAAVVVHRHHHHDWRRDRAECRTVRERVTLANGNVIIKTRHHCD